MCARCFPTTTEVVVTSSLTKPRTLISTGLSVSNSKYTGARVPNRVPVDRLAGAVREAVNPATMRASEWRDPDSNRGHHDFQSCGLGWPEARNPWKPSGWRLIRVPRRSPLFTSFYTQFRRWRRLISFFADPL